MQQNSFGPKLFLSHFFIDQTMCLMLQRYKLTDRGLQHQKPDVKKAMSEIERLQETVYHQRQVCKYLIIVTYTSYRYFIQFLVTPDTVIPLTLSLNPKCNAVLGRVKSSP